jgi:hypothetical protein
MSVLERFRALREARAEQATASTPPRARESRPDGTEPRVVTRNVSMRPGAPESAAAPVAAPKQAPAGRFPRVTGTADVVLAATIIGLVFFGVVMVYSASGSLANTLFDDGYHYLVRQGHLCGGGARHHGGDRAHRLPPATRLRTSPIPS